MQHSNLIMYNPKPLQKHPKPHQRKSLKRPNITPLQNTSNLFNNTQTTLNHTQTTLNTHISLHRKIPYMSDIQRSHAYLYNYGFIWTFSRQTHRLCVYPYSPHMRLICEFRVLNPIKTWFETCLECFR